MESDKRDPHGLNTVSHAWSVQWSRSEGPAGAQRGGNPNQRNERGMESLCRKRGVSEKGKQLLVTGFAGDWGRVCEGEEGGGLLRVDGWKSPWFVMSIWQIHGM